MKIVSHSKKPLAFVLRILISFYFSSFCIPLIAQNLRPPHIVIKMSYDASLVPLPVIQARLNGSKLLNFVIDTGSSLPVMIDSQVAQLNNVTSNNQRGETDTGQSIRYTDNAILSVPIVTSDGEQKILTISGKGAGTTPFKLFDEAMPIKISGVIGLHSFANATVQFDFVAKEIRLFFSDFKPTFNSKTVKMSLVPSDDYKGLHYLKVSNSSGETQQMLVDTGAQNTTVNEKISAMMQGIATGQTAHFADLEGITRRSLFFVPQFNIGAEEPQRMYVALESNHKAESLLGMDYLARFVITIDMKHKYLALTPNEPSQNFEMGYEVVNIEKQRSTYIVDTIIPKTGVARSGLRRGDRLISIDSVQLEGLSPTVAQRVLNGVASRKAEVEISRGGKRETITYARYPATLWAAPIQWGIRLHTASLKNNKIIVETILPGTPAGQSSLKRGEEIISINKTDCIDLTYEQILVLFEKGGELSLVVNNPPQAKKRRIVLSRFTSTTTPTVPLTSSTRRAAAQR